MMVLILASLFGPASVAITFNTIRLQIPTQREEIEVAKLIGATKGFIRRPFMCFGAMPSSSPCIAAWLMLVLSLLLNWQLGALAELYASHLVVHPLAPGDSGCC